MGLKFQNIYTNKVQGVSTDLFFKSFRNALCCSNGQQALECFNKLEKKVIFYKAFRNK